MDQELNHTQYKNLLENIANTLQGSASDREDLDPETLSTVLKNTHFFHRNLEAPANLHDFVHLAKDQLSYEVFPYGSVLIKEGDYADRLCLILRGTTQKLQQRPYEELEREIRRKNPKAFKEDAGMHHLKSKESSLLRNNPRYLQHTVATKKKTHFTKNVNPLVVTLNKISSDASNGGGVVEKGAKTLNNLERGDQSGGENANDRSLNEQEWDDQITKTLDDDEELPVPTKSMVFNRLRTLNRSNTTKKSLVKLDIETASLDELGMEGEDSDERGKKKDEKGLTEDDMIMLRYLAAENPEIKQRLFVGNIPRVEKGKGYKIGECFGDNFYKENRPKETSIMVVNSEELHILSLSRESYQDIMVKIVLNAKEKADFFTEVFPSFDSDTVVKFSYHFSEKQFKKNEMIYHQDHLAQELYLLKNGDVRLTKEIDIAPEGHSININIKRGDKTVLPVASIIRQQFFGEELLLKEGRRLYTAMAVSSGSTAYFISLKEYNKIKNGFADLLKVLKQQTRERFGWRQQRVVDLLEKRRRDMSTKKTAMHIVGIERATGEEIVHKSPRGLDLTRMAKNNSDGAEDNTTINSGRGEGYVMLTKVKSAKNAEGGSKNLELYKAKYSRKTKLVEKALMEEGHIKKRGDETLMIATVPQGDSGPINYNIRRELATVKSNKLKLPMIKSPKTTSIVKDIGYVKSINSIFREPSIANLEKKKAQARSSVLDHMRYETMEDGMLEDNNKGKGKMTHLPLRMYGLVKRVEEKGSIFTQKDGDEFAENSHLINFHKIKFPKKVAGGFKMSTRKTSGDMLRVDTDHDFTLIAGRKTELLNK